MKDCERKVVGQKLKPRPLVSDGSGVGYRIHCQSEMLRETLLRAFRDDVLGTLLEMLELS